MTIEEIEESLPNGLHDSQFQRISVDYERQTARLELLVDVSEYPEPDCKYRPAALELAGVLFVALDLPDPTYPYGAAGPKWLVDTCEPKDRISAKLLDSLPTGTFPASFFVDDWNGFVNLAAREAKLVWLDE